MKYRLSDLFDIIGGGTPKTSNPEYWGGPIPWISVVDMGSGFRYINSTIKSITERGLKESSTKILQPDDLIISARGTVGIVNQIRTPMAFNQTCYGLRAKVAMVDANYLFYLMVSQVPRLLKITHGAVFDTLTRDSFGLITVDLPPLETQREIAHVLGTLDDKIELNRRMNKTLEEIAQALFKHWFIDFEFPNEKGIPYKTSGGEMVDSELGQMPKGWRLGQLKELVDNVVNRVSVSERKESMPYVPIECISPKTLCLWNSLPGVKAQSSLIKFDQGDILFGAMRPYFHKVCIAPFEGTTRTTAFVLRARPQEVGYALMLINQKKTIAHATNHSEGSTIPYAKWDNTMGCMDIVVPDKNTMLKYGALMKSFLCYMNTNVSQSSILSNNRTLLFEHFSHNS